MWKEKLMIDLKEAKELALKSVQDIMDGGTCNFDSVFVELARKREIDVMNIIKSAGLSGYKTRYCGCNGYLIMPPNVGQASRRTKAMESMLEYLKSRGYNAYGYYQMD